MAQGFLNLQGLGNLNRSEEKIIVAENRQPEVIKYQESVKLSDRETVAIPTIQKPENNQFKSAVDNQSATSTTLDNTQTVSSKSTARSLLKFAGTWAGDDLEECLKQVYQLRGENSILTRYSNFYSKIPPIASGVQ